MLDSIRLSVLVRINGDNDNRPGERQAVARQRVAEALSLSGGTDTASRSCLWHVVGMECSVRGWLASRVDV